MYRGRHIHNTIELNFDSAPCMRLLHSTIFRVVDYLYFRECTALIESLIIILTADETFCLFKIPLERFASAELLSYKRFLSSISNDTYNMQIRDFRSVISLYTKRYCDDSNVFSMFTSEKYIEAAFHAENLPFLRDSNCFKNAIQRFSKDGR
ncbi:unnamed protein product [Albugo candida]|uniref:Uncharacterized protein n=1 Tax=Albugo candida TaxID=65357 RepID=A0A024FU77_9STRA|nr:unnamed protein product [Albugo candida]|eukprot:CCI10680.1 unnamed protein product [Albugo candida]